MKKTGFYLVAFLFLMSCSQSYHGKLQLVEPGNNDSFNYPYYLFLPDGMAKNEKVYLVVEPNNSGFVDDELNKHIEKAERTATRDFYIGNYVAHQLKIPLLVPVFPRPKSDPHTYTHALDRDAMLQKNNPLERIDNQLIAMIEDARKRLAGEQIKTHDTFLLTGFSASGTFANRFTLLHPEHVRAVAAGGLNGVLMLPLDSLQNQKLTYPVGTGDLKELTTIDFQATAFRQTPQFYFMGQLDDNDAVPYDDAFDPHERELIYTLLGQQMQPERWNQCRQIYKDLKVNARMKTFENAGHEHPDSVKQEIVEFFKAYSE